MSRTMTTGAPDTASEVQIAHDRCALSLVRRLAALLDRDPSTIDEGQPLPRGWHVIMFNVPTRQADLRPDGAGALGVVLPDLGLPRLMMGGRNIRFLGEIPIGANVRRDTRLAKVAQKNGRSGPFALVDIEHSLFVEGSATPALVETTSYVLRPEADDTGAEGAKPSPLQGQPTGLPMAMAKRQLLPTEPLLFRYSAITDNPHRIHYDLPYAQDVEKYPALLVNGSLPSMFLLEMLRMAVGREPDHLTCRNLAPMFCGTELMLSVAEQDVGWAMLVEDAFGRPCLEARAW